LAFLVRLEVGPADPETIHFEFKISSQDKDFARFEGAMGKPREFKGLLALPLVAHGVQVPVAFGPNELRFRISVRDTAGKESLSDTLRPITVFVSKPGGTQTAPNPAATGQ
jgi:hypothetical protein